MNARSAVLGVVVVVFVVGVGAFAVLGGPSSSTTPSSSTSLASQGTSPEGSSSLPGSDTTVASTTASSTTSTATPGDTTTTDGPENTVPPVTDTSPSTTFDATTTTFDETTTTFNLTTTTYVGGQELWVPAPGVSWQWQLDGVIDTSVDADVFDVDLFETPKSVVDELRSLGRRTICYLSAGSSESFRPDFGEFPAEVMGNSNGWPGEKWLDIRRIDVLGPIMEARLDLCRSKGFDGVEFDNVDGYSNNTGFALTASDQVAYNRFLADAAHVRGLSAGLKNDVEQAGVLEPFFEFAINEECFVYSECGALSVFIDAGKAVLHVEYEVATSTFCPTTTALGFSSMKKRFDLDAWREICG